MKRVWSGLAAWALLCPILSGLGGCAATPELRTRESIARKAVDVALMSEIVRDAARSDRVRMKAAKALAASTDPTSLDPIFSVVRDRQARPLLRAAMIRVATRSPDREAVAAFLVERLTDEREATEVRSASAMSLGILKDVSSGFVAQLQRTADDSDPAVRLAARSTLARIGGEGIDVGLPLMAILQDAAQPDTAKVSAAERLGALKDARALPVLILALGAKSSDESTPYGPQDIFAHRAAAQHNLPAAAARALGRLSDPAAIPALIDAASTHQGEARAAAYEALAVMKASEAVPAARTALSDRDQRVRRWAALLLREVGAREALPELRQALGDEDPGVRLQAVLALERLNDRESVETIREALSKEILQEVRDAMENALRTLTTTQQSLQKTIDRGR